MIRLPPAARYGVAVAAAIVAVVIRLALDPIWGIKLPYITLFPAIMVAAWLGGLWPGILTALITGAAAAYFWIEPTYSWRVTNPSELLGVVVFVAVGVVISVLNEAWRRGAAALWESEERLKVTVLSIGDAIVTTDERGRVTRLNPVAEHLTGWSAADAIGRPLRDVLVLINEDSRQPAQNPVDRVLSEGVVTGLANHAFLVAKDGREIPIDDSAAPIRTEEGRMAGVVMVFRDVSERRPAEREREALLERERAARIETERLASAEQTARAEAEKAALAARESEERLRITIASIGDAVVATDERGRITQLNPVGESLTGWQQAEALGRPLGDVLVLVNEETRRPAPNPVERVLREGVVAGLANHTVLIARSGRETPIDDSAAPVRTKDGRLLGAVMVFRDISERRQIERERAARERMAREVAAIVESSDDAIVGKDLDGTITAWNGAAERMYAYTAQEALGQSIRLIVPEDRWTEEDEILGRIRRGERVDHFETVRRRKDGTDVAVSLTISPIRDAAGTLVGASKIARDISSRKQMDQERAALLAREHAARLETEHASKLKDEFLAVLSHELRTPLNAVLGYAHLLSSGVISPERSARALDAIQRNAQAQARLVEELLDLSRIMAGKLELDRERLDLSSIVTAAVDVIRPEAEAKGIAIDCSVPGGEVVLAGDGGRLQQVFWNLLSNAIKFTPRGGRVDVRVTERESQVGVEVSDNGQGIGPDFLPYVFDRFRQAESHKGRSPAGLGLGLALVREMVQAHGGSVVAESRGEGRGSTFTLTLPLSMTLALQPEGPAQPEESQESLSSLKILIVDDDGDVRDLLALLLESRGAKVSAVSSASEALDAISERSPDVLLADLRMPEEDGYSLIGKLRAREREQNAGRLPAIAVTAYASAADRERAITAGYDAHVAKPVDPAALARAIAKVARAETA